MIISAKISRDLKERKEKRNAEINTTQEASDRKRNWRMPKKRDFLLPEKNLPHLSFIISTERIFLSLQLVGNVLSHELRSTICLS